MDLPEEILGEILSHIRSDGTSALAGLQIALTCKSLYQDFQPVIAALRTKLLSEAQRKNELRFDNPGADRRIRTVRFVTRSCDDSDTIWSLIHLLSGKDGLNGVCTFILLLRVDDEWLQWNPRGQTAWSRAMLKLLELLVQHPGIELVIDGELHSTTPPSLFNWASFGDNDQPFKHTLFNHHPYIPDSPTALAVDDRKTHQAPTTPLDDASQLLGDRLASTPFTIQSVAEWVDDLGHTMQSTLVPQALVYSVPPLAMAGARTTDIKLRRLAFHPVMYSHINLLTLRVFDSLTHLELHRCKLIEPDWQAVLPTWTFTRLSHLHLTTSSAIGKPMILFLQRHPSIVDAKLFLRAAFKVADQPCMGGESPSRVLPNLQNLEAYPIGLHQLTQSFTLPALNIVAVRQIQNDDADFAEVTTSLSLLPLRAPSLHHLSLNMAYVKESLNDWLRSATSTSPIERGDSTHTSNLHDVLSGLKNVKSLTLTVHQTRTVRSSQWPPDIYVSPELVVDFVAAFPSLEKVVLQRLFYNPPREERPIFWASIRRVWDVASSLQRLELSGVGGAVTVPCVWVRGEREPSPGFDAYFPA
ncbi:hypothetical protein D9611_011120 [Ephemerocybe angulata]|uniref:Uncharacterized protein n=1 Tax=Ephemerocybe angulata TaxID=980116 RepID=A0A8H5CCD6_9AGAR|nr:hypothetical protein D9611_011120 [Tulosesus angulatus]